MPERQGARSGRPPASPWDAPVLPRRFFARPAEVVAPELIGCVLAHTPEPGVAVAGRIVETEAYLGPHDRACHAWGGRRTPRNEALYAEPGVCYVYIAYGLHTMVNVSCVKEGYPAAVLIRALEPLAGIDFMKARRPVTRLSDLCSGPGKLCQALGITRAMNGLDLVTDPALRLLQAVTVGRADPVKPADLARSSRVGVDSCGPWAEAPLRWYVKSNPHVSPGRPSRDQSRSPTG